MPVKVELSYKINALPSYVYSAIIDKNHLKSYFVKKASSSLSRGIDLTWEFSNKEPPLNISNITLEADTKISFDWDANPWNTHVEINIWEVEKGSCYIRINEKFFTREKDNFHYALIQTQHWAEFVSSLKAYLYAGIDLRK